MPHTLTKDGLRIHFEASGSGTPVLLLHPNHATCKSWIDLGWFDALAASGFRSIALDARGFGDSEDVATTEHLAPGTSSNDVRAVLDVLDLDAAHVCGFSLGAAAALRFAIDEPWRVRALVLGGLGIGPLVQMGLFLGASADDARRRAFEQLERVKPNSDRTARYFRLVREVIASATLARVDVPDARIRILGIAGDMDPQTPFVQYEQLRNLGISLQTRTIAGAAHGTCFSDGRFREAAIEFLADSAT